MRSLLGRPSVDKLCKEAFQELQEVVRTITFCSEDEYQLGVHWKDSSHAQKAHEIYKQINAALKEKGYSRFLRADRVVALTRCDDKAILELIIGGMLAKELNGYATTRGMHVKKVRTSKSRTTIPPARDAAVIDEIFNTGCPHETRSYHELHGFLRDMANKGHYVKVFGYLDNVRSYHSYTPRNS